MALTWLEWWCLRSPRHKLAYIEHAGVGVDKCRCTKCGRLWALNRELNTIVPWREVAATYEHNRRTPGVH